MMLGGGARARALQAVAQGLRASGASAKGGAGGKKKKGGAGAGEAKRAGPTVAKEIRAKATVGANILKDGSDPPIKADSEYPDWLWGLLDKQPPLSELERKDWKTMDVEDLKRLVKLDNRKRIKEVNQLRAKN